MSPPSPPVLPRPSRTSGQRPERMIVMSKKPKNSTHPSAAVAKSTPPTLAMVLTALERNEGISPTRRRDLISAVKRLAELLGQEVTAVVLDMRAISAGLEKV